jgi:hypothetical protein
MPPPMFVPLAPLTKTSWNGMPIFKQKFSYPEADSTANFEALTLGIAFAGENSWTICRDSKISLTVCVADTSANKYDTNGPAQTEKSKVEDFPFHKLKES